MSAEEFKKFEADELKAKQAAEAKKAAEKDALEAANLAKAQALEASGKKVAGGMHKFDASEVDVNGGDATADDLMRRSGSKNIRFGAGACVFYTPNGSTAGRGPDPRATRSSS